MKKLIEFIKTHIVMIVLWGAVLLDYFQDKYVWSLVGMIIFTSYYVAILKGWIEY